MPYKPHTSSRSTAMPADYAQCRVRKQSNECESETRLVRARGQALRLLNAGALGALKLRAVPSLRPKDRFARTRLYLPYFSSRSPPRDYINSCEISAQFLSTYHSVRLHEKTHRLFFSGRSSNGTASRGTDFLFAFFIYRQASTYSSSIFGTRPRSGYTSELAGRIYLDYG